MFLQLLYLIFLSSFVLSFPSPGSENAEPPQLLMAISAKKQIIEVAWRNVPLAPGDKIFITAHEPKEFQKINLNNYKDLELELPRNANLQNLIEIGAKLDLTTNELWQCDSGEVQILETIQPQNTSNWIKTSLKFDYSTSYNVNAATSCYGHWSSYVNSEGKILATGCIRAYPTWMNDMKSTIGKFRLSELFIPGSHDSGSYKPGYRPGFLEEPIKKYSLTQDDNIKAQLMHGIRYLDIRVGYYKLFGNKFMINHGVIRQRPLEEALVQLRDFVAETNEIVIFDVRQFPYGFGDDLTVHHKLVEYLKSYLGDYLVDATLSWDATLDTIWASKKNIILTYGNSAIISENRNILFDTVHHRWGNVQDWPNLENYLKRLHGHALFANRPVSDMAELTPDTWGVILDKYGGLRKMADDVNLNVSKLYTKQLGPTTNIVSADFYRGTNIVQLAIYFNKKKAQM